jgi:hypothetical protein
MDCRRCHNEVGFRPARRDHPRFALTGSHLAETCASCHPGGRYLGTPRDCSGCHQEDFARTTRPSHSSAGFADRCDACHNTATWIGARYQHRTFIARGMHRTLSCDRCHTGARFDGAFGGSVTAWECASCHTNGAPVPRRPADHQLKGYPDRCELCHNEIAWKPARRPQ